MIETLTNNHLERVLDLLEGSENKISIVSPFLSVSMAKKLCEIKAGNENLQCTFITRLYLEDVINKANSIDAIRMMKSAGIRMYAVKGLHTKLYLFDEDKAIIGSANFTSGGFVSNIELSLAMEDEPIIGELHTYFESLRYEVDAAGGLVTDEVLQEADELLLKLFGSKKGTSKVTSAKMYGADIGLIPKWKQNDTDALLQEATSAERESNDAVTEMFREMDKYEQIFFEHNIWLKFTGTGENRQDGEEAIGMEVLMLDGKKVYLSNYPTKPSSVKDGDEVYIAALTTDTRGKNQPVIIGRGTLCGFSRKNYASDELMRRVPWKMDRYPWYCVIEECEMLNTTNKNGIPLEAVLNRLGSDTYISSYGKNESIADVGKKHYQKAHIRLSGNAKEFIDARFDELVVKYGSRHLKSE